jgi:hypothetical protein
MDADVARTINHANGLHDVWQWGLNAEMDRLMAVLRDDLARVAEKYGRPIMPPAVTPSQDAE